MITNISGDGGKVNIKRKLTAKDHRFNTIVKKRRRKNKIAKLSRRLNRPLKRGKK